MRPSVSALAGVALVLGLLSGEARAFDCGKARTVVEKAICADPALKADDDRMVDSYEALSGELDEQDREALKLSQRAFIGRRENCSGQEDGAAIGRCVGEMTRAREALLAGRPASGPGPARRMVPLLIWRAPGPKAYRIDVSLIKFERPGTPGEKAFNAAVDGLTKNIPFADVEEEIPSEMEYTYELTGSLSYASSRFVSLALSGYDYAGGAHGNPWTANLNVDLEAGREITAGDVLMPGASDRLTKLCGDQIVRQKTERYGAEQPFDPAEMEGVMPTIAETTGNPARWAFFENRVELTFDPYAVGSYAEGSYSCTFTLADLQGLLKPDAPMGK